MLDALKLPEPRGKEREDMLSVAGGRMRGYDVACQNTKCWHIDALQCCWHKQSSYFFFSRPDKGASGRFMQVE